MMDDWVFRGVVLLLLACLLGILALPILGPRWTYMEVEAQVEQLRADVASVNVAESEDVIGQVTQLNQTIAMKRRWNHVPVLGLFVPNAWDRLEFIELPTRSEP